MFKQCNKCGHKWETRDDFLSDETIHVIGYQVFFENLKFGMFLLNHSCGTTIAIDAESLLDLHEGPIFSDRKPDGRECPGRCLNENIMSPCSPECKCSFISEIMQVIRDWGVNR